MRMLVIVFVALTVCLAPVMAQDKAPSVAQKKVLLFFSKGFALQGGVTNFHPIEVTIHQVFSADLKKPPSEAESVVVAKLVVGKSRFPIRIISPKLEAFEADIVDVDAADGDKKVPIPIGHLSMKLGGDVAVGKLKIQIEDQKELSGQFDILLNDLTQLMRIFEMATAKNAE